MTVEPLLADSQAKLGAALELVFASDAGYAPFAPGRIYSPQELRDLRNRAVHDYLPDELAALYAAIIGEAVPELRRLDAAIANRLR